MDMQSIGLALTKGLMSLQSALPAAATPTPQPTFNYNGKTPPVVEHATNNLLATALYVAGGVFFLMFLWNCAKGLNGAKQVGGRIVGSLILAIVCLAPASAMTWASDFYHSIMAG